MIQKTNCWQLNIPQHVNYMGLDIVDRLIANNIRDYAKDNIKFATVNNREDLARYEGDLLIIKDVMQHWDTVSIWFAISRILPNFKYAILVNNFKSENAPSVNSDISTGNSRPLDLEAAPFFMKLRVIGDYRLPRRIKRMYLYVSDDQMKKASSSSSEATAMEGKQNRILCAVYRHFLFHLDIMKMECTEIKQ